MMFSKQIKPAIFSIIILLSSLFLSAVNASPLLIHHQLHVTLDPEQHSIEVIDQISLPSSVNNPIHFTLHPALKPTSLNNQLHIQEITPHFKSHLKHYQLNLPSKTTKFSLTYKGKINQQLEGYGKEQARGFRSTSGIISSEGVYLSGNSHWYPNFSNQAGISFSLTVKLPKDWKAISQGKQSKKDSTINWSESQPQEEIYLMAARFHEYQQRSGNITTQVFLRKADETLAQTYLQATDHYLKMYQKLLGDYPYSKFALVENFWETGYGMPSFTLLGSRVIRLPFILHSSYPHEILHNWWGNSVYIDYSTGNWSEGLTAYLSDHLIKEQQGKGADYRQQSLQKYNDYASNSRDFPLAEFRGRHSSTSAAIGYGKSLMLFHMLRLKLGDKVFTEGLQTFYQDYRFRKASFNDIQKVFEQVSEQSLQGYFDQWVKRTGAPALKLGETKVLRHEDYYELSFELQQSQAGAAYELDIPIAISLEKVNQAQQTRILMTQKKQTFSLKLSAKPLRLDIDPEFDLFRKLAQEESPPAFSGIFGSKQLLVVLPREAPPPLNKAYQNFAQQMQRMGSETVTIKWDDELKKLPETQAIALLGWENSFLQTLQGNFKHYDINTSQDHITIDKKKQQMSTTSIALAFRQTTKNKLPISFIAADLSKALPKLARKLPHYHKYSYLTFSGEQAQNTLKGRWAVKQSPMSTLFTTNSSKGNLASRSALIGNDFDK